ncbi:hypothetical protein IW262DRAFT_1290022 [Armillaria fumosa]|nr:hypothetical protein IW262DRAFT_1290022 [Armillaria fumosa]
MAYIEQWMNTEHGFHCSIEVDRPTECLHTTEQAIKWHMKAFFFVREGPRQATNDSDNNDSLLDNDEHHSDGQGIGGMVYTYRSVLGCDAKEVGDQGGWEEGRMV